MTISEAMAYIQGYQKSGKPVHDLSRIQALLDAIGNPQEQLQVIHIAGTNGKGSVTAFCAAAATAAGFRTGTLTSPFIQHYTDRIQIDGQDIPGEALCRFCEQVKACPVSADCSQFEITFAIALLWFLEQHCDLVVLETGIGSSNDFRSHREDGVRQVQAAVTTRHGQAPEASLAGSIEVLECLAGIDHAAILQVWTFEVNILRVWFDDVSSYIAGNIQQSLVVLDGILVVDRSIFKLVFFYIISFLQVHNTLHKRMIQVELYLRMVCIIISHFAFLI